MSQHYNKVIFHLAEKYNWFFRTSCNGHLSFKKNRTIITIDTADMTVNTILWHPKQGLSQLYRRHITGKELMEIFHNPRIHTNKGFYYSKQLKSQTMSTENSPTKLIIKNARLSYAQIWEPKAMLDKAGKPQGEPKYSVALLIPKSEKVQVKAINDAFEAAKEVGKASIWKGKIPKDLKGGLRDGDSKEEDASGAYAGHWFINATSKQAPGVLEVVSGKKVPMTDKTHLYSGCYAHVSVNFYPFDNMSNGVACGLNNILKVKDGEPLGGRASAEADFADVEVETDVDDTDDL